MNNSILQPTCESEVVDAVKSCQLVRPIGSQTKPSLSADQCDATIVSLAAVSGVVEYEPSEYTFTALAGTRVDEIAAVLAQRNQYLPFDPMLVAAGATIGGSLASGLSGPGRFRFGGLRDFVIGVNFVSGEGNLIRAGGKVVKNAAGFDLPKMMVGSLGRLGVITSLNFKVFPRPIATRSLAIACQSDQQAMQRTNQAAASHWELDAIDYRPGLKTLFVRIAGPPPFCDAIAAAIREHWGQDVADCDDSDRFWFDVNELKFAPESRFVVKVPITAASFLDLEASLAGQPGYRTHVSAAGNVMWIAIDDLDVLAGELTVRGMAGLVVQGETPQPFIGTLPKAALHAKIQHAMDPLGKFPL
ncbi:putative FAD-linked oxidoreductase [Rubripirellula lacrimiformis]|uniref:Putative FAD-linked oxidoreductase n=1 Tax=Rubripirellula lacrimiformis TaxID=1930273 RepID=A0A517NFD8_9BACT|nr:FAD-binding protein [Rubripirellula lacrimiformis]QDT05843.1 putative FAD-linked oxidoreductase [Rubripirellula lacrimiformis]